jgi:hypothetical protein
MCREECQNFRRYSVDFLGVIRRSQNWENVLLEFSEIVS